LDEVDDGKDLGVTMQSDLKWKRQCTKTVKTADRVLGMIRRSFSYLSKDMALHLYITLERPHLEYCVQAWRLFEKIHRANGRGGVQRRVTKLEPSMRKCSYEERLKFFKLTTLVTRRIRGNLIEVFKILKGHEDVNAQKFFELSNLCTRGHSLKLFKMGYNLDYRKFTFTHRIMEIWNIPDEYTVVCDSLNGFKS
jgi:ribonucleases P/MRP protein subunit RPP40